jgi:hypothetical protein
MIIWTENGWKCFNGQEPIFIPDRLDVEQGKPVPY